ncbi:MAG: hypothetical protein KJ645_03720 [Planctomycetes bacterium]|nr:hypothetical protein [Planctomycetota bacterium]
MKLMRYRNSFRLVVVLLGLFVWAAPGPASEILIVPSSEAAPYETAKRALEEQLILDGYRVRSVLLKEAEENPASLFVDGTKAVVAIGTGAAVWLHQRLPSKVKLTYCMVSDPAAAGLNDPPEAHGIGTEIPLAAQMQVIAEALPEAKTLGMLYSSDSNKERDFPQNLRSQLPDGWRLEAVAIDRFDSIADAIDHLYDQKIDVIWTHPDSSIYSAATVRKLLLTAIRKEIPVFGYSYSLVKSGCLLGLSVDIEFQGRQAAKITHCVLHPETTASLSSLKEVKYQIVLNHIVAEQISVTFPDGLMNKAVHQIRP